MDVRLLLSLLLWSSVSLASTPCALPGKLCKLPGEQSNQPECCAGACVSHHCIDGTTSSTLPLVTTTTNSRPPSTTSTLPRPSIPAGTPIRYGADALGIRFRDSTEALWDPYTGLPATQYEANVRISTLHWVMFPEVLRLLRDTPACNVGPGLGLQVKIVTGKFFIHYSLRALRGGDVYSFKGRYLWDEVQPIMRRAAGCVPIASVPANLRPLFATSPPPPVHQTRADDSHTDDGLLDPHEPLPPLSASQCALLATEHEAHEAHVAALLAHDYALAASLAPRVVQTQLAFEASARTLLEQANATLIFTGSIDPKRTPEEVDHFTMETSRFHHEWVDAFHCGTGVPDLVEIWSAALGHARAHFLRAITLPGLSLQEVCPADVWQFHRSQCIYSDN